MELYKGSTVGLFRIKSVRESSWNDSFKGTLLSVEHFTKEPNGEKCTKLIHSAWFDGSTREGIRKGRELVAKAISKLGGKPIRL